MRRPRIADVVEWQVRRPGTVATAGRGVWLVTRTTTEILLSAVLHVFVGPALTPRFFHRRLPVDPGRTLRLGELYATSGTAPWMPAASWADRARVLTTSTEAWVQRGAGPRTPLDLDALRLRALRREDGGAPRRIYDQCRARLVGDGVDVVLEGPWIAFAWLGHLGGWPDPAPSRLNDGTVAPR